MDKIPFIVERLNQPPFNKGFATLTELDGQSSLELLDLLCEVIMAIDPDQELQSTEQTDYRVHRIFQFLSVMKFQIPDGQSDYFMDMMMAGDKDVLHDILHWCLQKFVHLQKRAYLAKYLMPVDVPADFMGDDRVMEHITHLKELQTQFKDIHKSVEQLRSSGTRPAELRAEIAQLETEKSQLTNKIQRLQKDTRGDEIAFKEMLKVTSALRKEQEEEVKYQNSLRDHRGMLQEVEAKAKELSQRLSDARSSGAQSQSAEQLLAALQRDVREINDRKETLESIIADRSAQLEKLQSWNNSDRKITEDDVRAKRGQLQELRHDVESLKERLDAALERNSKLEMFRSASTVALAKLREKEEEVEKLEEDKKRIGRQMEEKELKLQASGKIRSSRPGKDEMMKYSDQVKGKIEDYKKMRSEITTLRAELVVLQNTEQTLKKKHKNLDDFLSELERTKGVEGYRSTQRALEEMSEKTAAVDQMKGATLEQISSMVEKIGRKFKEMQTQLQPLINELKNTRQEYMEVEANYAERKVNYDKIALVLDLERQSLEKECDSLQEECLREESRYHYLNNLIFINNLKLEKAEQERKWQAGEDRMLPNFASFKDLYTHKIVQQEQYSKQLRAKHKLLTENSSVMTNQRTLFKDLSALLEAKVRANTGNGMMTGMAGFGHGSGGGATFAETMIFGNADVMMV